MDSPSAAQPALCTETESLRGPMAATAKSDGDVAKVMTALARRAFHSGLQDRRRVAGTLRARASRAIMSDPSPEARRSQPL